jgi:hypothetical protein
MFLLLFLCLGLHFGLFNNRIIINKISESNYFNKVYEELLERSKEVMISNNLPTELVEEVITLERVYVGGSNYIANTLYNRETETKVTQLTDSLQEKTYKYLKENEITITREIEEGIQEVISIVTTQYRKSVEFQFINYITVYRQQVYSIVKWLIPILIVLCLLLIILLLKVQSYKHRSIRYITYSLLSASGLLIIGTMYLLLSGIYKVDQLTSDYYMTFLNGYLKWSIQIYLYLGGMGIVICCALVVLMRHMKTLLYKNK